jgi:hypothetical protein
MFKKNCDEFHRTLKIFPQKVVIKLSIIWVLYPGSEIRDPEKTYSGSRKNLLRILKKPISDPGSGSATLFYYLNII